MLSGISVMFKPGVMVMGVPLPMPGSVSIKYSACTMFCAAGGAAGYAGADPLLKERILVVLHLPSASRLRMYKVCGPGVSALISITALRLAISVLGARVMGVPLPKGRFVSNTYSTLTILDDAGGAAAYTGVMMYEKGAPPLRRLHLPSASTLRT